VIRRFLFPPFGFLFRRVRVLILLPLFFFMVQVGFILLWLLLGDPSFLFEEEANFFKKPQTIRSEGARIGLFWRQ